MAERSVGSISHRLKAKLSFKNGKGLKQQQQQRQKVGEKVEEASGNARVIEDAPHDLSGAFRWLTISKTFYIDESGVKRVWESVARPGQREGVPDAVYMICFAQRPDDNEEHMLLVTQFRPPMKKYVLEVSAGLVDDGETAETAALRELKEETGYVGTVVSSSPMVSQDPGLSRVRISYVTVNIDFSKAENKNPKAQLEEGEFVQRHWVPKSQLLDVVNNPSRLVNDKEAMCEGSLFALVMGLSMA